MQTACLGLALLLLGCGDAEAPGKAKQKEKIAYDGGVLYRRFCLSCHGETGTGDGVSAKLITIQPRDFTQGIFKFRSTLDGMPTDEDLFRTIKKGVGGTEMSPYHHLPDEAISELVKHVKSMTVGRIEIEDEEELEGIRGVKGTVEENGQMYGLVNWFEMREPGKKVVVPEPPPPTPELVAQGRKLFEGRIDCVKCHGPGGLGDGPSADELKDDWGFPISPRNFVEDRFKGGSEAKDIYMRIVVGIPGTPMPSSANLFKDDREAWALVYYVMKLSKQLKLPESSE